LFEQIQDLWGDFIAIGFGDFDDGYLGQGLDAVGPGVRSQGDSAQDGPIAVDGRPDRIPEGLGEKLHLADLINDHVVLVGNGVSDGRHADILQVCQVDPVFANPHPALDAHMGQNTLLPIQGHDFESMPPASFLYLLGIEAACLAWQPPDRVLDDGRFTYPRSAGQQNGLAHADISIPQIDDIANSNKQ
jgi:hypothetical protein